MACTIASAVVDGTYKTFQVDTNCVFSQTYNYWTGYFSFTVTAGSIQNPVTITIGGREADGLHPFAYSLLTVFTGLDALPGNDFGFSDSETPTFTFKAVPGDYSFLIGFPDDGQGSATSGSSGSYGSSSPSFTPPTAPLNMEYVVTEVIPLCGVAICPTPGTPAPCDYVCADSITQSGQIDTACSSVRRSGFYSRYFSFEVVDGSTNVQVYANVYNGATPYIIVAEGLSVSSGTVWIESGPTQTANIVRVDITLPIGIYQVELSTDVAAQVGDYDIDVTGQSTCPGETCSNDPLADSYCTVEINGPVDSALLDIQAVASGTSASISGNNVGYTIQTGEQTNLSLADSFESYWIRIEGVNNDGRVYTLALSSLADMAMELYDATTLLLDVSTLALTTTKQVTGQGTTTLSFSYPTTVPSDTTGYAATLRVFSVTAGGGDFNVAVTLSTGVFYEDIVNNVNLIENIIPSTSINLNLFDILSFLEVGGSTVKFRMLRIAEKLKLFENNEAHLTLMFRINSGLIAKDSMYRVWYEYVLNSFGYIDTIAFLNYRIEKILERLSVEETMDTTVDIVSLIASRLSMFDAIARFNVESLDSAITLLDSVQARALAYATSINNMLFTDTFVNGQLKIMLSEHFTMDASVSNTAQVATYLRSNSSWFGSVGLFGQEFFAYSINTQSIGISKYINYNFNSFAYPYAAASDGIYKLDDGVDDNGSKIKASIKTGVMDFGSSLKKQVPYAYIGITSEDRILLKTISTDRGVKKERWYEVNTYNTALDTTKVKMGKGVKAKYWQFELSSIDGEDFEVNSLEILPIVLKRRVQ